MKLAWPVEQKYKIISAFWEDNKTSPYYKRWGFRHNGVDFSVETGSNLYAVYDMTCYTVQDNEYGKWVGFTLDGLKDSGCLYGHLSDFGGIKIGDKFKNGQLLPIKSGNTGKYTSGSHLHFGCWIDGLKDSNMGNYTDPLALFLDGEVIENYLIKDNSKHLTNLPTTIKLVDNNFGAGYLHEWLEMLNRIKLGEPMKQTYDYELVNQSDYPLLSPGEATELSLVLKNTGTATWMPFKVNLGVPDDRPSRLYNENWLDIPRPCTVANETPPGGQGLFNVSITIPKNAKSGQTFELPVNLVVENQKWFTNKYPPKGIYWVITIK